MTINSNGPALTMNGGTNVKVSHTGGIPVKLSASPAVERKPNTKSLPPSFYASFISAKTARFHAPNSIRGLLPLEKAPGVISLLAGKPNPETFPISGLQVTVRVPYEGGPLAPIPEERKLEISDSRMADALQYGPTSGYEPLIAWLERLQARTHGRTKGEGWRISIGSGSQDLLYKAFHALVNPGD